MAVVFSAAFNTIAALRQTQFQLLIWNGMTFFILQTKAGAQLPFVVSEQLNIKVFGRNNDFAIFLIISIQQIKVATIASACLSEVGRIGGVGDEVINAPAYVNAGFTTAVEYEKVILWRQFFILENILARLQLFFRHRMLCVTDGR